MSYVYVVFEVCDDCYERMFVRGYGGATTFEWQPCLDDIRG